jgi:hypothetical protein
MEMLDVNMETERYIVIKVIAKVLLDVNMGE